MGWLALRDLSRKTAAPRLVQYDHWGRRVDVLETSEGWRGLKAAMQAEGVPGIFYERRYREMSRVYGFMKAVVAVGDSSVVSALPWFGYFGKGNEGTEGWRVDFVSVEYDGWGGAW